MSWGALIVNHNYINRFKNGCFGKPESLINFSKIMIAYAWRTE